VNFALPKGCTASNTILCCSVLTSRTQVAGKWRCSPWKARRVEAGR